MASLLEILPAEGDPPIPSLVFCHVHFLPLHLDWSKYQLFLRQSSGTFSISLGPEISILMVPAKAKYFRKLS